MAAVDIGIRHDDDLVVPELLKIKLVSDARTTGVPVIASINCIAADDGWTDYAVAMEAAGAAALELNIFLQPTDRHRTAQELEQDYADGVRRVAAAVKIPVAVKLPMRLTNVLAVADSLLARGARGVVLFNRFFEPDIDVERMAFVNGNPFSEPAELRNVLRSVALCSTALPQLDVRGHCGAGLLGDPREGLRGHCRHQPVHRTVG